MTSLLDAEAVAGVDAIGLEDVEQSLYRPVVLLSIVGQPSNWESIVCRLRDHISDTLYVLDTDNRYQLTAFLALGLVRQSVSKPQLYIFQRRASKPVPTWLNSKYWANPERFDAERW